MRIPGKGEKKRKQREGKKKQSDSTRWYFAMSFAEY